MNLLKWILRGRVVGILTCLAVGWSAPVPAGEPDKLLRALAEFNRGAALLEKHQYTEAAEAFEKLLAQHPDWTAARFNLGVACFQMQKREDVEKAREAFEKVLESDPHHLHARFCLGLCHEHLGEYEKAFESFRAVHEADGTDAYVTYECGVMLVSLRRNDEAVRMFQEVIALDPGFTAAYYRLGRRYHKTGERDKARSLFDRFRELHELKRAYGSFQVSPRYGWAGSKYSMALGVESLPLPPPEASRAPRILFSPEVKRLDVRLESWKWAQGAIDLPGIAVGDLNGDGHLDLVLTAAGHDGTTAVWLNDGAGNFSGLPPLTDQGVSPCLGDVDNDGQLDLWLGRAGDDLLFLGDGKGGLRPADPLGSSGEAGITACARLVDLDINGGLDLLSLRWAEGSVPAGASASPAASRFYANPRNGQFSEIAADLGLALDDTPVAAAVCDDFDNDYDLDLQEVPAESGDLHFLGYAQAYSPDGGPPELYDYDKVERSVPWKRMKGDYTRYGEVAELIREADDCYVIMGRGEEVTLRFPVDALEPPAPGCQRSFLFKFDGYTKDMDLFTACSGTVEPLPFHAMRSYPYGPDEGYPENARTKDYRRRFNTRRVE